MIEKDRFRSDAYDEGYKALEAAWESRWRIECPSNPYPPGSPEHESWNLGYDDFDNWLNYGQYQD